MTREQELEQRYQDFQEWLNICPLVVTDYQDFTDQFQITFSLEADSWKNLSSQKGLQVMLI